MNKTTFKLDTDFDLELDFKLVGISSTLKEYRLCHFINKHTGLTLIHGKESYTDHRGYPKEKEKDDMDYHIIQEKKKGKNQNLHHFTVYRYCNVSFDFEYYLISNKSKEGGLLIPEAANFDYFVMIKHYIDEDDFRVLMSNIKSITDVLLTKEIDPTILKSKENLIF